MAEKPVCIRGLWEARKIDGVWCVGKAGAMKTQADAAMVLNHHDPSFSTACLAMMTAEALSRLPILPPPYDQD